MQKVQICTRWIELHRGHQSIMANTHDEVSPAMHREPKRRSVPCSLVRNSSVKGPGLIPFTPASTCINKDSHQQPLPEGHQRPVDGCRPYSKKSTDISTCLFWVCSNTGYLSPICKSGSQAAALKAPPCRSWPPGSQMAASGPWRCMQTPLSMTVIATSCHPTYAGGRGMHEA